MEILIISNKRDNKLKKIINLWECSTVDIYKIMKAYRNNKYYNMEYREL